MKGHGIVFENIVRLSHLTFLRRAAAVCWMNVAAQVRARLPRPRESRAAAHRDPLQRGGGQVRHHDRARQDPPGNTSDELMLVVVIGRDNSRQTETFHIKL